MRKFLSFMCVISLIIGFAFYGVNLYADEVETNTGENSGEVVEDKQEEAVVDGDVVDEPLDVTDLDEEEIKKSIQDWLEQYVGASLAAKIISWLFDLGALGAVVGILLKYRKYKSTTIEDLVDLTKQEIGKYLTENFEKLSIEEIDKIKNAVEDLQKSNETIMKVLVLMQDNSTKGRATLVDFLGTKTESVEVKEVANEVAQVLEEEQKVKEEVVNKVADDYKDIF